VLVKTVYLYEIQPIHFFPSQAKWMDGDSEARAFHYGRLHLAQGAAL
jgi:hypothetical protein